DEPIPGAPVLVLGQNPGADEEREGRPFVGRTGEMMVREWLPRAGLIRGENVSIANTLRCRWQGPQGRTNNLPNGKVLNEAIRHCTESYFRVPAGTKLIVAQGAVAWKAMGGPGSITDWRGFLKPDGSSH